MAIKKAKEKKKSPSFFFWMGRKREVFFGRSLEGGRPER